MRKIIAVSCLTHPLLVLLLLSPLCAAEITVDVGTSSDISGHLFGHNQSWFQDGMCLWDAPTSPAAR